MYVNQLGDDQQGDHEVRSRPTAAIFLDKSQSRYDNKQVGGGG